jgi:hypothetical protein
MARDCDALVIVAERQFSNRVYSDSPVKPIDLPVAWTIGV